jgi:hypothetical protein
VQRNCRQITKERWQRRPDPLAEYQTTLGLLVAGEDTHTSRGDSGETWTESLRILTGMGRRGKER